MSFSHLNYFKADSKLNNFFIVSKKLCADVKVNKSFRNLTFFSLITIIKYIYDNKEYLFRYIKISYFYFINNIKITHLFLLNFSYKKKYNFQPQKYSKVVLSIVRWGV